MQHDVFSLKTSTRGTGAALPAMAVASALALAFSMLALVAWAPPLLAAAPANAPSPRALPLEDVVGDVYEAFGVTQAEAEILFSEADAALWIEGRGFVRWMESRPSVAGKARATNRLSRGITTSGAFRESIDLEFPGLKRGTEGGWLLKLPSRLDKTVSATAAAARAAATATAAAPAAPAAAAPAAPVEPSATVFTDGFEAGLGNWFVSTSTSAYNWGAITCDKHSGSYSADALRGGTTSMTCDTEYQRTLEFATDMEHNKCEALSGASQAWLDFWMRTGADDDDYLGVFYSMPDPADPTKLKYYGYYYNGTITSWWHLVHNLKQWVVIGDVTTVPCPAADFYFYSDGQVDKGTSPLFGARVDDVTVRTDAPPFLKVSATATPSSGAAPLTVSFTGSAAGATSPSYTWYFDDAANSSATGANASFTYTTAGNYYPSLWVVDSATLSAGYASARIVVGGSSACTISSCTATVPATAQVGTAIQVTASASISGCTGTPQYYWQFGDTTARFPGQNMSHTFQTAGTYSWVMSVEVDGKQCIKNGTITVGGSSTCPTISILQVDTTSCPTAKVITSVRDAAGNPVAGLATSNFCLNEDGSPQQITVKPVGSSGSNLAVAIALDNTGSVGSTSFNDEKTAAKSLVNLLATGDQAAIYGFTGATQLVKDFTTDKTALVAAIDGYAYGSGGSTNYYDTVYTALANTASRTGRKAVVALTDGGDNSGTIAPTPAERKAKVIDYANQLGIPVFTIGFGSSISEADLKEVATKTGGLYFPSATSGNLEAILKAIGQVLNGAYEVSYTTSKVDGQSHALEVCVISGSCKVTATGTVKCGNTPPPTCAATRTLAGGYMAGSAFPVVIAVNPPSGSFSHALEDAPPTGWTVSAIDNGGTWDAATGKVKWGPFFDTTPRVLHYSVTPPAGTSGAKSFAGVLSVDGVSQAICGDSSISPGSNFHPADTNKNNRIVVDEVTAYGAAWKSGATWQNPPVPIPIDYVTNAGFLWKSGEAYHYSASANPPFVTGAPVRTGPDPASARPIVPVPFGGGTATASFSSTSYTPGVGVKVSLDSRPQAGTFAWAVEDAPPAGWAVSAISDGGSWDATNAKVKYGPFFDATARVVTYVATPPAGASGTKNFAGYASFDGTGVVVSGSRSLSTVDVTKLLLQSGKVSVGVTWKNPYDPTQNGPAMPIPKDDQYGYFYFSDQSNPEVFIKVLDFGADRSYLLFWAGLTDFEYTVTFTNTVRGNYYKVVKPGLTPDGGANGQDLPHIRVVLWDPKTNSIQEVPEGTPILDALGIDPSARKALRPAEANGTTGVTIESREGLPGPAVAQEILLANKQVGVSVTWKSAYPPFPSGDAVPIPQEDGFCFFYFSDQANPEVFVKVLDWGAPGPFKIFAAGLTDFEFTVTYRNVKPGGGSLVFKKPALKFTGYADNLPR